MVFPKLLALSILLLCPLAAPAADPALAPSTRPARPVGEILADWKKASNALRAVLPSPQAVADPEVRAQVAPGALPLLQRALEISDEMYHADPVSRETSRKTHYHLLAVMAFLGDEEALKELDEARDSNHKEVATFGRHAWYLARWWRDAEDPQRSAALLEELASLAKAQPTDDDLAMLLVQLRQEGTATAEQDQRIQTILARDLRGPMALKMSARFRFAEKRRSLVGKPLVIAGSTLAGPRFSTATLKGKTVLVHFGATWCKPWEMEHNRLLEWYNHTEAEKLEFVTILCDVDSDKLKIYQERHHEIPWPVLRDPPTEKNPEQPLDFAAQYGIEQFPTTLVIAPDGTVQQIDVTPDGKLLTQLSATPPQPIATHPAPATQPRAK